MKSDQSHSQRVSCFPEAEGMDERDPWAQALSESRKLPSWPYEEVVRNRCVQCLLLGLSVAIALALCITVVGTSPQCPFNWGPNRIDRIEERGPGAPSRASGKRLAQTPDWLGVLGEKGDLFLVNKKSLLWWNASLSQNVIDVCDGPDGRLFALCDDQSISYVSPPKGLETKIQSEPWIGPSKVYWSAPRGQTQDEDSIEILECESDPLGWVFAVRGCGVARYLAHSTESPTPFSRTWETGSLSNLDLSQVAFSEKGVFLVTGQGELLTGDRSSLNVLSRKPVSSPIKRLETDWLANTAYALDETDALYLCSDPSNGWVGPFLGRVDQGVVLKSAEDVSVARLNRGELWLGTSYGLFAYDMQSRQLTTAYREGVQEIVPASMDSALAVTGSGLVCCQNGGGLAGSVDSGSDASVLDDNDSICLYRIKDPATSVSHIKAVGLPPMGPPRLLASDQGWRETERSFDITGTARVDDVRTLFVTSAGAFIYDERERSYRDCSKGVLRSAPQQKEDTQPEEMKLKSFTGLRVGSGRITALADGLPVVRPLDADSPWTVLTRPSKETWIELAEVEGVVLATRQSGELTVFDAQDPTRDREFGSGVLPEGDLPRPLVGDVIPDGDKAGTMAFLWGDRVHLYDPSKAAVTTVNPPAMAPGVAIQQVHLLNASTILLLSSDGRLVGINPEGNTLCAFGQGGLPFSSEDIGLIAPGPDEKSALVAGPQGQILSYDWSLGQWKKISSSSGNPGETIEDMFTLNQVLFATTASGKTSFWVPASNAWVSMVDYREMSADPTNGSLLMVSSERVCRLSPARDKQVSEWPLQNLAQHAKIPVSEANMVFAWNPDGSNLHVFTDSSSVITYRISDSSSTTRKMGFESTHPQFIAAGEALFTLDGSRLLKIGKDCEVTVLERLGPGASDACLFGSAKELSLAWVQGGGVTLRRYVGDDIRDRTRVATSRETRFDFSKVAFAEERASVLFLMDEAGNSVQILEEGLRCDPLRDSAPGSKLIGWFRDLDLGWVFVVEKRDRRLQVFGEGWDTELEIPVDDQGLQQHCVQVSQLLNQAASVGLNGGDEARLQAHARLFDAIGAACDRGFRRPRDGLVLRTENLRATRVNGKTTYSRRRGEERWIPISFVLGSACQDVAFSDTGGLWVLENGRVRPFADLEIGKSGAPGLDPNQEISSISMSPAGYLVLEGPKVDPRYAKEQAGRLIPVDAPVSSLVSRFPLGDNMEIAFEVSPKGDITSFCRAVSNGQAGSPIGPGWDDAGGRFTFQTIESIAVAANGEILTQTPLGVVVRDAAYRVRSILPHLMGMKFHRLSGRVFLEEKGVPRWEWTDKGPETCSPDSSIEVEFLRGPWEWRYTRRWDPVSVRAEVSIENSSNRARAWVEAGGEWRFSDDVIKSLRASDRPGQVELLSKDAACLYDRQNGRTQGPVSDRLDGGNVTPRRFENPAIKAEVQGTTLSLIPFDGPERGLFQEGRFFFDKGHSVCSGNDSSVFVLIPGRCVIRRDARNLGRITGCWPVPEAELPQGTWIEARENRLALITGTAKPEGRVQWEMDPSKSSPTWEKKNAPRSAIETQFVRWIQVSRNSWKPSELDDSEKFLASWWKKDRFSWDDIQGARLLGHDLIVLVTDAGAMVLRYAGQNEPLFVKLFPVDGVVDWHGAQTGVVLITRTGESYKVQSDEQGVPNIAKGSDPPVLPYRIVKLTGHAGEASGQAGCLEWAETRASRRPDIALVSDLPDVPTSALIQNGQFFFDRVSASCALKDESNHWITVADFVGADGAQESWICLNDLNTNPAPQKESVASTFTLSGTWKSPARPHAVRSDGQAGFLLLCKGDADGPCPPWSLGSGRIARSDEPLMQGLPWDANHQAFRVGQDLTLDLSKCEWRGASRFAWNAGERKPLSALLSRNEHGFAFAFDVFTSLSYARGILAIGTLGGAFTFPRATQDPTPPKNCTYLPMTVADACAPPSIARLRWGPDDVLFAELSDGRVVSTARDRMTCSFLKETLLTDLTLKGTGISISPDGGAMIGKESIVDSMDAWTRDRRPLSRISDGIWDAAAKTLWLSSENGVFRTARPFDADIRTSEAYDKLAGP